MTGCDVMFHGIAELEGMFRYIRAKHLYSLNLFCSVVCGCGFITFVRLSESFTRAVRKVSSRFEYLKNRSRGLDATWQPVRRDLTVLL
jgi:hypothetical protein